MRISYSLLDTFKQCPYKYKLLAIDKIKEPKNPDLAFGSYIHYILHWFYSHKPQTITLKELLGFYEQNWSDVKYTDLETKREVNLNNVYYEEGKETLETFYKSNKEKNNFNDSLIIGLETKFESVIQDKNQNTHILSGVIDRVDKIGNEEFEIIDYKTNRTLPSFRDVQKNQQLALYGIGVKQLWPNITTDRLNFSLYLLKFNEKITIKKTNDDLEQAKEEIINTIKEIESINEFSPKPSKRCSWCGFKDICPVFKELYTKSLPSDAEIKAAVDRYFILQEKKVNIEKEMKSIENKIDVYLKENNLIRIHGDNGYFTKTEKEESTYDWTKVKNILEPLGKWDKIISINKTKFNEVLKEIPQEIREKIEQTKYNKKVYKIIQATNYNALSPFQNGDINYNKDQFNEDDNII